MKPLGWSKDQHTNVLVLVGLSADDLCFENQSYIVENNYDLLVVIGHTGDELTAKADLVLPGTSFTETTGWYVNMEGRCQQTNIVVGPSGDVRPTWSIIRALTESCVSTQSINVVPSGPSTSSEMEARVETLVPTLGVSLQSPTDIKVSITVTPGLLSLESLKPTVEDFYLTDPISRSSKTIAVCSSTFTSKASNFLAPA